MAWYTTPYLTWGLDKGEVTQKQWLPIYLYYLAISAFLLPLHLWHWVFLPWLVWVLLMLIYMPLSMSLTTNQLQNILTTQGSPFLYSLRFWVIYSNTSIKKTNNFEINFLHKHKKESKEKWCTLKQKKADSYIDNIGLLKW